MTEKRKWRKGPPPHVGWWNASATQDGTVWRWWNGVRWSEVTWSSESCRTVRSAARVSADLGLVIQWTDYYPENARVPRVDPRKVAK